MTPPVRRVRISSPGRDATGVQLPRPDLGALIERVATGNRRAFEELYRRTAGSVYALVRRILADEAASAEVTRDIYVRIWAGAHTYRRTLGSAESWLVSLTHRCAVDGARAAAAPSARARHEQPLLPAIAAGATGRSLSLLTPEQVEALELAYFGGLTHADAARKLGVDRSTLRLRVSTALARLHQGMDVARPPGSPRPTLLPRKPR
jgi:RNA polymerase sigma-70 factor (ECF subfamily)